MSVYSATIKVFLMVSTLPVSPSAAGVQGIPWTGNVLTTLHRRTKSCLNFTTLTQVKLENRPIMDNSFKRMRQQNYKGRERRGGGEGRGGEGRRGLRREGWKREGWRGEGWRVEGWRRRDGEGRRGGEKRGGGRSLLNRNRQLVMKLVQYL